VNFLIVTTGPQSERGGMTAFTNPAPTPFPSGYPQDGVARFRPSMEKVAGLYVRISSDPTGAKAGVERQEADCRELAERRGWTVCEVFIDNDVSAFKAKKRPAYEAMLTDIEAGRIQAIVCWHPDRLYRRLPDLEHLIDLAAVRRVEFATVTAGEIDLSTPTGRMYARNGATLARYEVEHRSERVQASHDELRKDGRWVGAGRFGYDLVFTVPHRDGRNRANLAVNEDEARLIRSAVTRLLKGASLQTICAEWNRDGHLTRGGYRWSIGQLKRTLTSPTLCGLRGQGSGGQWPGILTEKQSEALRAKLGGQVAPGRPMGRKYSLSGLAMCSKCCMRMVGSAARYRCTRLSGGCQSNSIASLQTEALVIAAATFLGAPSLPEGVEREPVQDRQAALLEELAVLEARLDGLAQDYADGVLDRQQVSTASRRLRERAEKARSELSRLTPPPIPTGLDTLETELGWAARWRSRTLTPVEVAELHAWLSGAIERVEIGPAKKLGRGYDATRVVVVPKVGFGPLPKLLSSVTALTVH
jgi:site-specific DNA recombinase